MAVNISTGVATGGAEQTLYETSGDATWIMYVDLDDMEDGDILVLRAKSPDASSTYRTIDAAAIEGGQLQGIGIKPFGPHSHSLGVRYTLEQSVGTGRTFNWRLDAL